MHSTARNICSLAALVPLLLAILAGCGVESEGTDGGENQPSIVIAGQIMDSNDLPLAGVTVISEDSGSESVTDAAGRFSIDVQYLGEGVTLLLLAPDFSITVLVPVGEVSPVATLITVSADRSSARAEPGEEQPQPSPSATPGATSTPKPTGPFDSEGNTTSFGIPDGVVGNITRGRRVWNGICSACHGSKLRYPGYSFSEARRAQRLSQHSANGLSTQQLADLTALLNQDRR